MGDSLFWHSDAFLAWHYGPSMGTWGTGPFDNDSAADWAGEFEDVGATARQGMVREALEAAVNAHEYLDADDGMIAIAASALVAGAQPDGPTVDSNYGPPAAALASLTPDADLRMLASRAMTRVLAEDSEWVELWEEAGELEAARSAPTPVLTALRQPGEGGS